MKRWPIGLALPPFQQIHGPKALTIAAPRAEALGWDSIGVTDHIVLPGCPPREAFRRGVLRSLRDPDLGRRGDSDTRAGDVTV